MSTLLHKYKYDVTQHGRVNTSQINQHQNQWSALTLNCRIISFTNLNSIISSILCSNIIIIILRQKGNKRFFLVLKFKHDCSCRAKKLALTFWWPLTKKIKVTEHHHKLILHSSCHIQMVLVVATKVEQGTIRVVNKGLLVVTGSLIARTVDQISTSCHHWWYICLLHWIIQSLIHIIFPWFVNSHTALHITRLVINYSLIARTVTKRSISCHHQWYMCLLHWMDQSLICLSCPQFVNSRPDHNRRKFHSCKLLQYLVRLHLIRQIPCHRRPSILEVTIFMDA